MTNLCIVVPVFNDWKSLEVLLGNLNEVAKKLPIPLFVTVVNDGSTEPSDSMSDVWPTLSALLGVEVVDLAVNVGHQRAIAIGICIAVEEHDADAVLVMDGDGEDPPEQIPVLLESTAGRQDFCVVAQRRKRTERWTFKLSYIVYKSVFALLTGRRISFGNFSLFSRNCARRLVLVPDLWNNLAAAVLRSRLPIQSVPVDRGHRYAGTSKMNYVSLVVHGLSGISVYADAIFVRLLLFTIFLVCVTIITIASGLVLRIFFPAYATPGWATTLSMGMIILLLQAFFTTLSSILMLLNSRVQRLIMPRTDYGIYVEQRILRVGRSLQSDRKTSQAAYDRPELHVPSR